MSAVPMSNYFEYNIEVPINDYLDKNTENLINYLNKLSPQPFIIQYWKDDEETKKRRFLVNTHYNIHNLIYHLFNPFQASYVCYYKTRVVM
jgi:hypothetical protein